MPQLTVQNQKLLFADAFWRGAMSEEALGRFAACLPEWSDADPKFGAKAVLVHAAIERLPLVLPERFPRFSVFAPKTPSRAWLSVGSFSGRSGVNFPEAASADAKDLGWLDLALLSKMSSVLEQACFRLKTSAPDLQGMSALSKKASDLIVRVSDPVSRLLNAQSFALCRPSANAYMDAKGSFDAPLASARLFESAEAVERSIKAQGLSGDLAIVEVKSQVARLVPRAGNPALLGALSQAIAELEAREMQAALDAASIEALRERVAQLSAQSLEPPSAAARSRGRRI